MSFDPALKQREEEKRDSAYTPQQRWQHIMDAIAFAEANMTYELRKNRPRVRPLTCKLTYPDKPEDKTSAA